LIPYFIMLAACGIPLLYMEYAVGQLTRQGPAGALAILCPLFQGAGLATVVLSFLLATYYNVIMSWAMFYMGASFQAELPWTSCNNSWNTADCFDSSLNSTIRSNSSTSPTEEYYDLRVLKMSSGIEEFGGIQWELLALLVLSWIFVYLALWKGIKLTGKVVYFTAIFPYVMIFIVLAQGVTLEGSKLGIDFFINPKWELLKTPKVWVNAAAQNFNSIGIAFGSMIAFSSYKKQNSPILRDVLAVTLTNSVTSLICGFAIFSVLGHIAHTQGKDVESVVADGPGLVFVVFPEAFKTMPIPQFFSFLFFFMLLCMAIDSQFASVEVVLTTLQDQFGKTLLKSCRREVIVLVVCLVAFVLGLPNIFNGGIYFFKIIDKYSSGISLMLVALFEVVSITWFYGAKRLAKDIAKMTGSGPFIYFTVCWSVVSPLLIAAIMVFNWIEYTPITFGDYEYPVWGDVLGWMLAALSLICIPLGMMKALWQAQGDTMIKKFMSSLTAQSHRIDSVGQGGVIANTAV